MLDLVRDTEFNKELDEVSKMFDVVVISFVGLDVAQEDYVVGEIEQAFGLRLNDKCGGKCRVVRGETDTVAVFLVGQSGKLSAEVGSEIFLYIGDCIS